MAIDPSKQIRDLRLELGFSQVKMAELLGLSKPESNGRRTVARWEAGQLVPRQVYINLALALLHNRRLEKELACTQR
jgi:transcriptional regulator with XRE-family HTH domain